jgi:hypothetical protein
MSERRDCARRSPERCTCTIESHALLVGGKRGGCLVRFCTCPAYVDPAIVADTLAPPKENP